MRRIALFIWMLLACLSEISGQKSYALLVGVSNYQEDALNLASPKDDAKKMYDVLGQDPQFVRSIIQNRYASKKTVLEELSKIAKAASGKDCIVFFFAGHGENGYLIMADNKKVYYSDLIKLLKKTDARHVYCFIDACHSGSIKQQLYRSDSLLIKSGINFVMACREDQYATESSWIGHGYFSQALIKGLKGYADKNKNGQITLCELYKYVLTDVTKRAKSENVQQTPQLIASKKSLNTVIIHYNKNK